MRRKVTTPAAGKWLAEYKCGCMLVETKKRELLAYCQTHGDNRRRVHKLDEPTETGWAK